MKRTTLKGYDNFVDEITSLLESARRQTALSINAILTATYWEIGRRIVEFEQSGKARAKYGSGVLEILSKDLTAKYGKGFSVDNLENMRLFYTTYPPSVISETLSRKSINQNNFEITPTKNSAASLNKSRRASKITKSETLSRKFDTNNLMAVFPLSWSHYVRLLQVKNQTARKFYETEALRGGWSIRQLDRQINTQFYERTVLSKNKAALLIKGSQKTKGDIIPPEEEIKNPFILEFLGLKDEYSESDLEAALITHLETFLLELGGEFTFIARQKRLRIGTEWYKVDLVFYHRKLRCLVLIDLKLGKFTHADAGQMHLYLNFAKEYWTLPEENPPVGLILCAYKDSAVAHYALDGLPNKIMAAEYKTTLPGEKEIAKELEKTRRVLDKRKNRKLIPHNKNLNNKIK